MQRVPVVKVKEKESGRVRIIDESAFDEKVHTVYKDFDSEMVKSKLDVLGVKYAKNIKDDKLQELFDKQPMLNVIGKEDKFIIVNKDGVQQGQDIYDTFESANSMIELLKAV